MSGRSAIGPAYRVAVAGRVALAVFGGYAVAALATALLALVLPLSPSEAVSAGTLASFAVMAGAIVWVFAARTLWRAALPLAVIAAVLAGALWLAGGVAALGAA